MKPEDFNTLYQSTSIRTTKEFVVEGRFAVEALLASDFAVLSVLLVGEQHEDLANKIPTDTSIIRVSKAEAEAITGFAFHRGVIACARRSEVVHLADVELGNAIVLCPELADEGNLGTLIRNAAGLGADAVLVDAGRGADPFSRKAIRASSGAVFRIPVHPVNDLLSQSRELKSRGFTLLTTALSEKAVPLSDCPHPERMAVVFGPEKDGLSEEWLELADHQIMIPMETGMDSLNVGCSSAIILHELLRNPGGR